MRKLLLCVPMITLLLAGCGGKTQGSEAEQLALLVRGEYLEMTACSLDASITADYGQRVYQYELSAAVGEEETVQTGTLDSEGLTPMSALPALLETAQSGYIAACALEEQEGGGRLLRIDCGDPEGEPGTGTETTLWFDSDTCALVRGEISVDGFRVITCECSNFTFG